MTSKTWTPGDKARLAGRLPHDLCGGRVYMSGDADYDAARIAWNLAVDQRPAAVAVPRNAADVQDLVRAAGEAGVRLAPQSTGHNAGPLAAQGLDNAVVVKMSSLDMVVTEPQQGIVRVEGGALWEPAVVAAGAHGHAVLHGSSPDVGISGYTLGGGLSWYARKLGLAANSVTAAELVVGDGTLVRATHQQNSDLFWAVRGGGGGLGIVTALEFKMYPIRTAYAGILLWDLEHIAPVLREWSEWAPSAPDEITTSFRAMRMPPLPMLPEFLSGRSVVMIDGALLGTEDRGKELLASLRALGPEVDTFAEVPATSLMRLHMDPEGGAPGVSGSALLSTLPADGVDAFIAEVGPDASTSLLLAELRQLGGAIKRPPSEGGALDRLPGDFLAFAVAMATDPEAEATGAADASRLMGALRPYAEPRGFLSFTEHPVETRTAHEPATWARLRQIAEKVDPQEVFMANHSLHAAQ